MLCKRNCIARSTELDIDSPVHWWSCVSAVWTGHRPSSRRRSLRWLFPRDNRRQLLLVRSRCRWWTLGRDTYCRCWRFWLPFSPNVNGSDRHLPLGFSVVWCSLATANNVKNDAELLSAGRRIQSALHRSSEEEQTHWKSALLRGRECAECQCGVIVTGWRDGQQIPPWWLVHHVAWFTPLCVVVSWHHRFQVVVFSRCIRAVVDAVAMFFGPRIGLYLYTQGRIRGGSFGSYEPPQCRYALKKIT